MGKERHEKKESSLDKKGDLSKLTKQATNAVIGLTIAGTAANLLAGAGK